MVAYSDERSLMNAVCLTIYPTLILPLSSLSSAMSSHVLFLSSRVLSLSSRVLSVLSVLSEDVMQ